jgi:hypothetical protein
MTALEKAALSANAEDFLRPMSHSTTVSLFSRDCSIEKKENKRWRTHPFSTEITQLT